MNSLKNTVEKMNSPARRRSSILSGAGEVQYGRRATVLYESSSENERPSSLAPKQLGKHLHGPSEKRRSPRKLPRTDTDGGDLEGLLHVQKDLYQLRGKVLELTEMGDLMSAQHWLQQIQNEPLYKPFLHWSDNYRYIRLCISLSMPAGLILESFKDVFDSEHLTLQLVLIKAELMAKEGMWELLSTDLDAIDFEDGPATWQDTNWEREQFPSGWVPLLSKESIRGRLYHFSGLAYRNLGKFELAIDAFDLSTCCEPFLHASVAQLVYEQNALIPVGQRRQYLETLSLRSSQYTSELESLFASGNYEDVLKTTGASFSNLNSLLCADQNLLVVHLGCLLGLKKDELLFDLAHKLVQYFPQRAISWYAVGLYYEVVKRYDDSRRYLM